MSSYYKPVGETDNIRRIKLKGARFDGGHLPVDSFVEIERYQETLRSLAVADWQSKHPGEPVPRDLQQSVSLTIVEIKEGSAELFIAFENAPIYSEQRIAAQDYFDSTLQAAYLDLPLPDLPESIEEEARRTVSEIGSTLSGEQSIEFFLSDDSKSPIIISVETRLVAKDRLLLDGFWLTDDDDRKNELETEVTSVAGRVTLLDADAHTYSFESLRFGQLKGRYKNKPELLEDFKKVLDDAARGPVTRLDGIVQTRNGKPWRIWETSGLQLFSAGTSPWSKDLIELASLDPGWDQHGTGHPIAFFALEAADQIMAAIASRNLDLPALFPTTEGGVLIEWSSSQFVKSIEISADAEFQLFHLRPGTHQGEFEETNNLSKAIEFASVGPS